MTREEKFNDYEGFVEKFKPKKTTDDCYTPPAVYEAVKDWACRKYSIDPACTVRPFWPGGDYEHFDYPAGAVVLDNPHPDTPTRVWTLSDRERQIIAELNHKDNESPCAAP